MGQEPIVGVTEAAKIIGVSRQRVSQLARDYADFPLPVAVLASGRVWERTAVEAWTRTHPNRRPGRRSRAVGGGQQRPTTDGGPE